MAGESNMHAEGHAQEQARPLRVIVVGAGIAGLTVGIILRNNGHRVQIYEQSRFARELGAAVHMAPNAHGLLKKMGIELAATGANEVERIREYAPSGTLNREIDIREPSKLWQHKWMLAHRMRLHDALKEKALAVDGPGNPCELHLSTSVVEVDPKAATITLKDGSLVTGDIVVGADGVHSQSRRKVPGGEAAETFGSGKSGFRFMIRREEALNDPVTRSLCDKTGVFSVVVGMDRRIIMYPTSNNTLLNVLCIHPEAESDAGDDWNTETNAAALLHVYRDFAPEFRAILSKADPESLKLWKLLDMENMPSYVHSRLALIGDAAHPFLPHQGQGAAMAMEDAVALGVVLEEGATPDEVPERLKLYNKIRYERACKLQQFTRLAGLDVQDNRLDTIEHAKYNFGHDEFDNSAQKLREWKWARLPEAVYRMPVCFGPDSSLGSRNSSPSVSAAFRTMSVRFKTSRTLLQNFFPPTNPAFAFEAPGTVVTCSLVHTMSQNLDRSQGASYNSVALHLHDVCYSGSDGRKTRATYVPVLFEDFPDNVVRHRELYGLPAVYANISVKDQLNGHHVRINSSGLSWADIVLEDLKPVDPQSLPSVSSTFTGGTGHVPLLAWRSMPKLSVKEPASAEEFPVIMSFKNDASVQVQQAWETSKATIHSDTGTSGNPKTLHRIVQRLAEIPIYQVMNATVVAGTGTPAFNQAQRIG